MRNRIAVTLAAVALAGCGRGYVVPLTAGEVEVSIAADAAEDWGELDHAWEFMAGSGHAGLYIRPGWGERITAHLADAHANLGVETVRFHGIFLDEVGVYQGPGDYDFDGVDRVYDAILAAGVKPFIELSFMPEKLASCRRHGFPLGYRPLICPPADYEEWGGMMGAFARHLVERYGLDEVRTWHFEVWNEPDLPVFWAGDREDYFRLYDVTVRAIKAVDPELQVGGPATSAAATPWIYDIIVHCRENDVPLDFLSIHGYGNESLREIIGDAKRAGADPGVDPAEGFYYNEVRLLDRIKTAAGRPDLPVFITEWNSSVAYSYNINAWPNDHDLANDAAYMCDAVKQANGYTAGFAHWTHSDVFEEWGLPGEGWPVATGAFHGGFGVITIDGIHKPAYHAFAFLHRMGRRLIAAEVTGPPGIDAMITQDGDDLDALVWYHLDTITDRKSSGPSAKVELRIENLPPGLSGKDLSGFRIDQDHGNPFGRWLELGQPDPLTPEQVLELQNVSDHTIREPELDAVIPGGALDMAFDLPPGAVVFLTTRPE